MFYMKSSIYMNIHPLILVSRLRMFMQIYIFMNLIKEMKLKQGFIILIKHDKCHIFNILCVFTDYMHSVYL